MKQCEPYVLHSCYFILDSAVLGVLNLQVNVRLNIDLRFLLVSVIHEVNRRESVTLRIMLSLSLGTSSPWTACS